ncbi:hypothetical protein [Streptomyces sp. NPDC050121]|uniref:hypothetical protein n=1 Tax=Streptomyces sp. NPDC050121 TaxID=3365601 RepID=UPI0037B8900B
MIATVLDTGPLAAAFNAADRRHPECASLLTSLTALRGVQRLKALEQAVRGTGAVDPHQDLGLGGAGYLRERGIQSLSRMCGPQARAAHAVLLARVSPVDQTVFDALHSSGRLP